MPVASILVVNNRKRRQTRTRFACLHGDQFDIQRNHGPFTAHIAQVAHTLRHLLSSVPNAAHLAESSQADVPRPNLHLM